ncbi:hypothetical protein [Domibacillus indicus]|uniref:hypothetical protein n=1 Tax=Domibacillus indicus TaxID=1437523 RepID=UPI000618041C|nr:hypothetical protein [Domibacillus indicus]
MFQYDARLGIYLPILSREWDEHTKAERQAILHKWEIIRGQIPDRISQLEEEINKKQTALDNEDDFVQSCRLNTDISELASIINDLWLWFRTTPDIYAYKKPHT